jgi:hypothetical protein
MTLAPMTRRKLVLLFNNEDCGIFPLAAKARTKVESHDKQNLLAMVKALAHRVLPNSEWDIRDYSKATTLVTEEWLEKQDPHPQPADLVIADIWFRKDEPEEREPGYADVARQLLERFKAKYAGAMCVLTATLPEPAVHDIAEMPDAPDGRTAAVLDQFVPLAHTNLNGWDEFVNLLKTEESRIIFREKRGSACAATARCLEWWRSHSAGDEAQEPRTWEDDVVIDGSTLDHSRNLQPTGHVFNGFVVFRNCNFRVFRLRNCEFNWPVLFENCEFEQTTVFAGCKFHAHLNFQSCTFKGDCFIERCHFAPSPRSSPKASGSARSGAGGSPDQSSPLREARFEHRLPWFNSTHFEKRFVFRSNAGVPQTCQYIHALIFHRCDFEERVDLAMPEWPTKLVFYGCSFAAGKYVDIRYPFDKNEVEDRVKKSTTGLEDDPRLSRFRPFERQVEKDPAHFDQDRVELRFCYCDLAARIVLREHPWAHDPFLIDELRSIIGRKSDRKERHTDDLATAKVWTRRWRKGRIPTRAIKYDGDAGLGLNLCGSNLTGSLNLRALRVKWINCERMVVLGGAIFMDHSALAGNGRKRRFVGLSPESSAFVFEELVGLGEERPRFTTLIHHSKRLIEYKYESTARIEMMRRIVQQYDDLARAFDNASNSEQNQDFCQYKAMMYRGKIDRRLLPCPHP